MSAPHDLGGRLGFGPVDAAEDGDGFHHEWEARVFAINRILLSQGAYSLDEFRYAVERMSPESYRDASYYERWLAAIETLLREKGIAADGA